MPQSHTTDQHTACQEELKTDNSDMTFLWLVGWGVFWLHRYNLNKLGESLLCDSFYIPNTKALYLVVSDKKVCVMFFPILAYVNHVVLGGKTIFAT